MAPEKRIDPDDGVSYTFDQLSAYYAGKFKKKVIQAYWDNECRPTGKSKSPDGKPKAKAKVKAKAKAKSKEKKPRGPANPKRFVNDEKDIVTDCLDGLVWSTPDIAKLDTGADIKVVVRTDWKKDKVALISGGGAGHEPMHGGFVGQGMLTAAVSGETFASPTVEAVLSAIVAVTGDQGCLLIIKNYTGDRLNFTLAAQRAREEFKLKVEIVITCDDVATVAKRGTAATLFVHKLAGAAAEAGKSLDDVKKVAEDVIEATASLGVSFSSVRRIKAEMIKMKEMEVGLGIHGEPGARTEPLAPCSKIIDTVMEGILAGERMQVDAPHGYACLVNNLGSVPPMEMSIVSGAVMKSKWGDKIKLLVGPAQMCTSLDMNGISISLLRLNAGLKDYLEASTAVRAWPGAVVPEFPKPIESMKIQDPFEGVTASQDEAVAAVISTVCKTLMDAKEKLDDLDSKVGDADCGSTMAGAGRDVLAIADKLPLTDPAKTCSLLSSKLERAMGGSSGVLMSIMFRGMAENFMEKGNKSWKENGPTAFRQGLQVMMDAGGAKEGMRTMLDALVPAADALVAGKGWTGAKEAAEAGCEKTKTMTPRAGRSENVPEKVWKNIPDPGAQAGAFVFAALAK